MGVQRIEDRKIKRPLFEQTNIFNYQNLHLQHDALKKAGCNKIITDKGVSDNSFQRSELDQGLAKTKMEDVFVELKLDRLGLAVRHLLN